VRTIEGNVVGDDSFFLNEPYGTAWGWDDLQWAYGAPASALSFNENMTELHVAADASAPNGVVADWDPSLEYYTLENSMTMGGAGRWRGLVCKRMPGACWCVRGVLRRPLDSRRSLLWRSPRNLRRRRLNKLCSCAGFR